MIPETPEDSIAFLSRMCYEEASLKRIVLDTLSRCQAECTRLTLENRGLRQSLQDLNSSMTTLLDSNIEMSLARMETKRQEANAK